MAKHDAKLSLAELHTLCWVALMAALIAAGALAQVSIGPVPVTFQEFFVALSGLVLGPRYGVWAVGLYIFAGAVGLPVFSGGRAGLGQLIGPTGGYFAGFLGLAFFSGLAGRFMPLSDREKGAGQTGGAGRAGRHFCALWRGWLLVLAGLALQYACGLIWLMHALRFSLAEAFTAGVAPFILPAVVKVLAAVYMWRALLRRRFLPQPPAGQ